jgi:hypothetical protein
MCSSSRSLEAQCGGAGVEIGARDVELACRRVAIARVTAEKVSGGNVLVSGNPPASEITSGRAVTAIMSRMAEDFMTRVRAAKSPA